MISSSLYIYKTWTISAFDLWALETDPLLHVSYDSNKAASQTAKPNRALIRPTFSINQSPLDPVSAQSSNETSIQSAILTHLYWRLAQEYLRTCFPRVSCGVIIYIILKNSSFLTVGRLSQLLLNLFRPSIIFTTNFSLIDYAVI